VNESGYYLWALINGSSSE